MPCVFGFDCFGVVHKYSTIALSCGNNFHHFSRFFVATTATEAQFTPANFLLNDGHKHDFPVDYHGQWFLDIPAGHPLKFPCPLRVKGN